MAAFLLSRHSTYRGWYVKCNNAGTPEVVAKALLEYYKLGATSLLIRGYDPRPDATQYGEELIPRIRELVADYDTASSAAA